MALPTPKRPRAQAQSTRPAYGAEQYTEVVGRHGGSVTPESVDRAGVRSPPTPSVIGTRHQIGNQSSTPGGCTRFRHGGMAPTTIPNPTKLHTLHLRTFNLDWGILDSLRLESLWLECLYGPPTNDQIFDLLRGSPLLRRLVLRDLYTPGDFSPIHKIIAPSYPEPLPEPQESSLIHLPHLETLILSSIASSLSHRLLWRLSIPSCKTLHVSNCQPTHFETTSTSELPKALSRIFMATKEIRLAYTARYTDGSGSLEIQTLNPAWLAPSIPFQTSECSGSILSVFLRGLEAWDDLAEAIGLKNFPGATSLSLGARAFGVLASQADLTTIPLMIRMEEDLRQTIEVLELRNDQEPILQYLSAPQPVHGAEYAEHWPYNNGLLRLCIAVLRRSSIRTGSLAAPRKLDGLFSSASLGLSERQPVSYLNRFH
ncbi:hypothetical protein FRC05_003857 [Tulasnella sp. 425]|nr:hypothetical protein FRC05_003857 [Tulasnella sp. 425]